MGECVENFFRKIDNIRSDQKGNETIDHEEGTIKAVCKGVATLVEGRR